MSKSHNGHSGIDIGGQPPTQPTPLLGRSQTKTHPLSSPPNSIATDMPGCSVSSVALCQLDMGGSGRLGAAGLHLIISSPMRPRRLSQSAQARNQKSELVTVLGRMWLFR